MAGRPVGFFVQVLATFVLAIIVGRLVLERENGWTYFALILPVLFIVLAVLGGWLRALVMCALFAAVAVTLRLVLTTPRLGWAVVLLALLFAASAGMVVRVAIRLLQDRRDKREAGKLLP